SQAVDKSPTHYPCDSARTFRVMLFSIHNDEWKSFQCHHQTALRRPYALSWKPCQGDSLNLPDHRPKSKNAKVRVNTDLPSKISSLSREIVSKAFKMMQSMKHVGQDTRSQGGKDDQEWKG
ncbi:hypothetical protein Tco_1442241, partial [Tanacetum coccineum]